MILFVRFAFVVRPSKFVDILKDRMDVDLYATLIVLFLPFNYLNHLGFILM